jgi:hypothetical protein
MVLILTRFEELAFIGIKYIYKTYIFANIVQGKIMKKILFQMLPNVLLSMFVACGNATIVTPTVGVSQLNTPADLYSPVPTIPPQASTPTRTNFQTFVASRTGTPVRFLTRTPDPNVVITGWFGFIGSSYPATVGKQTQEIQLFQVADGYEGHWVEVGESLLDAVGG